MRAQSVPCLCVCGSGGGGNHLGIEGWVQNSNSQLLDQCLLKYIYISRVDGHCHISSVRWKCVLCSISLTLLFVIVNNLHYLFSI
jgi:hypothetical protein